MNITRREALLSTLVGAGAVGLRALATGLPASLLLDPRRALAGDPSSEAAPREKAQFVIFATSAGGDPMGSNVPGTYEDPGIVHPEQAEMAPAKLTIRGTSYTAATPWTTLPQDVLDRTVFWHLMTDTPVHPKEPDVLALMGATAGHEMFPSILAKELAPALGTIQSQPISLGALSPSEAIVYEGQALPIIPALALKATLTNPQGPLTNLQPLRDQTLAQIYDVYKNDATPSQRKYVDAMILSQRQARSIEQRLLDQLASITDNGAASQILAAITLIQMNVTPVLAIRIPFGGDNHADDGLAQETSETVSGVATIALLMKQLASAGLADRVTFATLNVFGRTLGAATKNGRQHNPNHQLSLTIGKPFRGGVIGGLAPTGADYGALPIDSKSGVGVASGDIAAKDSLASFGRTLLAAVGAASDVVTTRVTKGTVVAPALALPAT